MVLLLLFGWLAGLATLGLIGGGGYILYQWWTGALVGVAWALLAGAMLAWWLLGRYLILAMFRSGQDDPVERHLGTARTVPGAGGSQLHVEESGPIGAPHILLTHGWSLDTTAWYYIRRDLGDRFRITSWDLAGLGRSTRPRDGQYAMERFAEDLRAVTQSTGGPVTLVGHSIGGMSIQTFCRLYPELLGREVCGIVFVNTTHTDPLKTIIASPVLSALRWPVIKPLLYLQIMLWPVVWLMNLQSYLSGTMHLACRVSSFSRDVTRGQLDFGAWFSVKSNPMVVAKGVLALLKHEETRTLGTINVPTTIVTGDADRTTLPRASEAMKQLIPGAELVMIEPAGHTGLMEEGDAYARAIAEAVGRHQVSALSPRPQATRTDCWPMEATRT